MDRAILRVKPRPLAGHAPPPREICQGVWALDRMLVHFGLARMPSRTTILRLSGDALAVISPPPLVDAETLAAIDALGAVRDVVVPNSFHYLYADELMRHYPDATLWVAPGLTDRVEGLDAATELGETPPEAWRGVLDLAVLGPVRGLSEVVLFHVPSGTLLLTDLAFNMVRYPRAIDRVIFRANGIPRGFGPGRTSRQMLLRELEPARRCLSRVVEWPVQRIVVAHGDVVDDDAGARLRRAFASYLPEPTTG